MTRQKFTLHLFGSTKKLDNLKWSTVNSFSPTRVFLEHESKMIFLHVFFYPLLSNNERREKKNQNHSISHYFHIFPTKTAFVILPYRYFHKLVLNEGELVVTLETSWTICLVLTFPPKASIVSPIIIVIKGIETPFPTAPIVPTNISR